MPHSIENARRWLDLILEQELPQIDLIREHASLGVITDLCPCGCHSFAIKIADGTDLRPLPILSGLFCELAFETNDERELNVLLFTDSRGYLCQVKVQFHACNLYPINDDVQVSKLVGIWPAQGPFP